VHCVENDLCFCRCFGLLISPGRNVKDSDMHVIDMVIMIYIQFTKLSKH